MNMVMILSTGPRLNGAFLNDIGEKARRADSLHGAHDAEQPPCCSHAAAVVPEKEYSMSFLRSIPDASLIDIFLAVPKFARPLHEFAQQLMRGPSPFTEGEREVMAAYVSSLNRCAFCEASHTEAAARYGHDRKLIQELALNLAEADVTDRLKPIFRYVRKLTLLPAQVDQADVTAIYEAEWDDTALSHAALVCAFFSFMNRWVDGLGIEADPTVARRAGEMLHQKGYTAVIELLDHARIRSLPVAATGEANSVSS